MDKVDITIIGAGVIGLATAQALAKSGKDILVVERHKAFGQETSSRNSEVIHAGIYYPPDSLKAKMCIRGKELLYALCAQNEIPHKKTGKFLAAKGQEEIDKIQKIKDNAAASGVDNLFFMEKSEVRKLEPNIEAEAVLFCPDTGIVDTHALMKFLEHNAKEHGVDFAYGIEVTAIDKIPEGYTLTVKEPEGDSFSFATKTVINAAGLGSDKIAAFAGLDVDHLNYRVHFCKGQYFRISHPDKFNITHPVYPPPSSTDLGIHITPDLAGGLRLGPDAEYVDTLNYDINNAAKEKFCQSVRRFLPSLSMEDIMPDTAGIRCKLQREDEAFRDFVIKHEEDQGLENFIDLIGIESPGLTASLAIAEEVKKLLFP